MLAVTKAAEMKANGIAGLKQRLDLLLLLLLLLAFASSDELHISLAVLIVSGIPLREKEADLVGRTWPSLSSHERLCTPTAF